MNDLFEIYTQPFFLPVELPFSDGDVPTKSEHIAIVKCSNVTTLFLKLQLFVNINLTYRTKHPL